MSECSSHLAQPKSLFRASWNHRLCASWSHASRQVHPAGAAAAPRTATPQPRGPVPVHPEVGSCPCCCLSVREDCRALAAQRAGPCMAPAALGAGAPSLRHHAQAPAATQGPTCTDLRPMMCHHMLLLLLLAPLGVALGEPPDDADTARALLSDRFLRQVAELGLWSGTAACSRSGDPAWQVRRLPPPQRILAAHWRASTCAPLLLGRCPPRRVATGGPAVSWPLPCPPTSPCLWAATPSCSPPWP